MNTYLDDHLTHHGISENGKQQKILQALEEHPNNDLKLLGKKSYLLFGQLPRLCQMARDEHIQLQGDEGREELLV